MHKKQTYQSHTPLTQGWVSHIQSYNECLKPWCLSPPEHFSLLLKLILESSLSTSLWNYISSQLQNSKTHLFTQRYWNVYVCWFASCDCNQFVPSFVVLLFVSPVSFTFVCCVAFVSFLFVSVPNVLHSILSICVCERPVLQEQNCCQRNKVLTQTNQLAINQQQIKGSTCFKRLNAVEAQTAAWSLAGMMFWTNTDADPGTPHTCKTPILLHLNYSRNEKFRNCSSKWTQVLKL